MRPDKLIDVSRLLGRGARGHLPTGVDRVCLAYLARWGDGAQAVVQKGGWRRIFPYAESQRLFELLLRPPADFARLTKLTIARACLPPWPSQHAANKPGFYLGHSGIEAPRFADWLRATQQKPIYFVHDLIPVSHPEYCRAGEKKAHMHRLTVMLQTGAGLIANSRFTLDALKTFAQSLGLAMPPSVVAPLAPALLPLPNKDKGELALSRPYFVVLGTIEPRKNHLLLLNIWREMAQRLGDACPLLVVIGRRGWECENVVDMLDRCEALQPFVREISACDDAELGRYLQHAQALLFPSFVEGYGMPLVEAMVLGTPVIASDIDVFREIGGGIPELLNPVDGAGWTQAVQAYALRESPARQAQLQRLQGFEVSTWNDHFRQVERLLAGIA